MSEPVEPPLRIALAFVLVGAPLLVVALRRAARVLPRGLAAAQRWPASQGLLVLAMPFFGLFLVGVILGILSDTDEVQESGLVLLFLSQLALGSAGALAIALALRRPGGLESLGLARSVPRRAVGVVLLSYLPFLLVFYGIALAWTQVCTRLGWEAQQEVMLDILSFEGGELVLGVVMAVLVAPFVEELFFRGFLQAFLGQYLGPRAGLALASGLFAATHGTPGLPAIFGLSLLLGWLQLRTRSLWVPCFAHALHNAVTISLALAVAPMTE